MNLIGHLLLSLIPGGGLHSQAAKGLAEKDAYIQRLERALETSAKSTDLSGTQKEIEKAEKLLPEGYAGMLTESDLALIKKTVGGTIQSVQQEQREAHSQAAEAPAFPTIRADYKLYFAHQLVFLYMTGKLPEKGKEVDHIDGDTSNDRWENLRIVST